MTEAVEDILEQRIVELEKKLFGIEGIPNPDGPLPETSIVDSLMHANSLLSTALSGREKINQLLERLPELESYAKTDYEPEDLDIDAKLEYILAMEPEIRQTAQHLKQIKELMPVLDSDRFNNLPEMSEKLHNLSIKYASLGEQSDKMDAETRDLVKNYNEIITNMSKTLISLQNRVSELEKEREPKKVVD